MKDKLANKADKRIFVKADGGAKYGDVVAVVDDVRSAGVDQLGLLTEERKQGALETPASSGQKSRRRPLWQWQWVAGTVVLRQTST